MSFILVFLVYLFAVHAATAVDTFDAYKNLLDPNDAYNVKDYELHRKLDLIPLCGIHSKYYYNCDVYGAGSGMTVIEETWMKSMDDMVSAIRTFYPSTVVTPVECALLHAIATPTVCQFHHVSDKLEKFTKTVHSSLKHHKAVNDIAECPMYKCEQKQDKQEITENQFRWMETLETYVVQFIDQYPTETWNAICAIESVLEQHQECQFKHASKLIASLSFIVAKDEATSTLIKSLNNKKDDVEITMQ